MNAEIDRIVTEYEELWRKAAIENHVQFHHHNRLGTRVTGKKGIGTCALFYPKDAANLCELPEAASGALLTWRCECGFVAPALSSTMIHLNNQHEWTWDMLANKFRDELARGIERAQAVR